ncbi:uncharacterized protein LACBIDRAFT_237880 [Laccaria bicolor S238N-H82]|uniref:carbonic anhydrase n=1 Tax=Laccaria bicolor (strain S238N-H82 / ATCC MYA-4686) TaxID=486041 RepID=B0DLW7_LACBS|nr:uncharacterized protein LACBIDRAFT_237880 [Laccaria bicolor S238N-H82]EDR04364.1 predicted protein [Laccaria bicolor S238N-H82]|eukprot:XP_001884883.1 predicted protein [Laccaria bicolor S238N-H82]
MLFQNSTFLGAVVSALLLSTSFVQGVCLHNHRCNLQAGPGSVPISNFSYIGVTGPLGWAGLNPANLKCSTANVQSPINIEHDVVPLSKTHPKISIPNVKSAEFENLGSTVEVVINGTTIFEGKTYSLKQYHFHTPAEHLIDAQFYPMEVHFVNIASEGSILVLAALFELSLTGTNANLLDPLSTPLHAITEPGSSTTTGPLSFSDITNFFSTVPLFKYTGSLTTPPCTDGVVFLVADTFLPMSPKAFLEFKSVLKFNARYVQNATGKENLIELAAGQLPK